MKGMFGRVPSYYDWLPTSAFATNLSPMVPHLLPIWIEGNKTVTLIL